jgi:hypothetical protein
MSYLRDGIADHVALVVATTMGTAGRYPRVAALKLRCELQGDRDRGGP